MIERGNVTTYEWTYGEPPLSVEEPKLDFGDDDENAAADVGNGNAEIDFDLTNVELEAPVEIDWGDLEVVNNDDSDVKIDWDAVDVVPDVQVKLSCRHLDPGTLALGHKQDLKPFVKLEFELSFASLE